MIAFRGTTDDDLAMTGHTTTRRAPTPEPTSKLLTYEDWLDFPHDDGNRHELIGGVHVVSPMPVIGHQRASRSILVALANYLRANPLGEVFPDGTGVKLSDHDAVIPDLTYVAHERAEIVGDQVLEGGPDLVVEVLSPSSRRRDEGVKLGLYERYGAREVWLVDWEEKAVAVHRRRASGLDPAARLTAAAGDVLATPLLPGFELPLAELFSHPRPPGRPSS